MRQFIQRCFDVEGHGSTVKRELLAGLVSFFTIIYIVAVNSSILSDAGIPLEAGIIATALSAFVGCLLMGLWGNAPLVLVPGMGVNALFSYTIVQSMGLSWQEGLAAVFLSGLLFLLVAFTRLSRWLSEAIPQSLKEAITVGIGIFLTFIGLQKGGLVVASPTTFVKLGNLGDPHVLLTIVSLLITIALFARGVKGNFLISIIAGTVLAALFGLIDTDRGGESAFSFGSYLSVFGAMSFGGLTKITFWVATYSLAMVVVFENIGLLHGFLQERPEKFGRSLQANALSAMTAGLFGSSPTITAVESAAGVASGGKTGLTAVTTGVLFLGSLFLIPLIKLVPSSAIAPILLVIGGLMIQNVKNIHFEDFSEGFPAFLIIALIPLTYSIADGIAFGFIAYPLLKLVLGRGREVAVPLYIASGLFFLNFWLHVT
jgi:adenine/guanine/hypoxanthine permease